MSAVVPVLLVVVLLLGAPIAVAVLLAGIVYLVSPEVGVSTVLGPLRMVTGLSNFVLLAVPLFIFAGEILTASGLTQRLLTFVSYLVGWLRAGLAQINVVMSMFMGGMSGLAMADSAAIGSVIIPVMKRAGYPAPFAAAVTGASSVVGPIIPPSVGAIVYAVIAGVSVTGIFAAGVLPGLLLGAAFMVTVAIWARGPGRGQVEVTRFTLRGFGKATVAAIPALAAPVIILMGIFGGLFTVTEASAILVVYAMIVGGLIYRSLSLRDLVRAAVRAVTLSGAVLFVLGAAAILAWAAARAQLPARLIGLISDLAVSPMVLLFLLGVVLLLLGTVFDATVAMIITVPIIAPLGAAAGIHPLQLGLFVILTLSLGLLTPPIGYVLFIVSELSESRLEAVVRQMVPFLLAALVVVVLVILWPPLTTWLPSLLVQ